MSYLLSAIANNNKNFEKENFPPAVLFALIRLAADCTVRDVAMSTGQTELKGITKISFISKRVNTIELQFDCCMFFYPIYNNRYLEMLGK